jgi:glycosyl hydrolase family 123
LQRNCDLWVPQLGRFDQQMDLLRQRIQQGHEVWFYTCLFPNQRYLNRLIDYPLLKVRLLHWFNFRYNFSGYLHWGWNFWSPEPTNDTQPVIDNNTELLPPGDAFIVYPDRAHQSVYSSIRFEAMREGIEDYELLSKLRATNAAEADRIAQEAIATFTDYVRDPTEFRKIERNLLEALAGKAESRVVSPGSGGRRQDSGFRIRDSGFRIQESRSKN